MQSWNATFFLFLVIRCGGGGEVGGDFGSGSGSKFNCAARVGSGRVRQSRVRAGFGLQFWARADLYPPLTAIPYGFVKRRHCLGLQESFRIF